jgi:hypothetical protein
MLLEKHFKIINSGDAPLRLTHYDPLATGPVIETIPGKSGQTIVVFLGNGRHCKIEEASDAA